MGFVLVLFVFQIKIIRAHHVEMEPQEQEWKHEQLHRVNGLKHGDIPGDCSFREIVKMEEGELHAQIYQPEQGWCQKVKWNWPTYQTEKKEDL